MTNAHLVAWLRAFADGCEGEGEKAIVLEAARVIDAIPDAPPPRRTLALTEEDVPLPFTTDTWPERFC
jgi:hypothetical protein